MGPMIFVHGAGLDRRFWKYQSDFFSDALAVDLPGHGGSEEPLHATIEANAAWLGDELRKTGPEPVTLIGHSMGSLIALEATASNPDMVGGLVLVGSAAPMRVHPDLLSAAAAHDATAAAMVIKWSLPRESGFGRPKDWVVDISDSFMKAATTGVLANDLTACDSYRNALEAAAKVRCPTLLLLGENDVMTKPSAAQPLAAAIDDARIVIVQKVGHMLPLEKSAEVNEAISLFSTIT